jgi:hypothetical protein
VETRINWREQNVRVLSLSTISGYFKVDFKGNIYIIKGECSDKGQCKSRG